MLRMGLAGSMLLSLFSVGASVAIGSRRAQAWTKVAETTAEMTAEERLAALGGWLKSHLHVNRIGQLKEMPRHVKFECRSCYVSQQLHPSLSRDRRVEFSASSAETAG